MAAYGHHPAGGLLNWLFVGYAGSLGLMFATNANWYEQSIASTDKWSNLRQAAKGGWAGLMAARAATFRYQSEKDFTVAPFGRYAVALFWAHLCATAKKPLANFGVPLFTGLAFGDDCRSHLACPRQISRKHDA